MKHLNQKDITRTFTQHKSIT